MSLPPRRGVGPPPARGSASAPAAWPGKLSNGPLPPPRDPGEGSPAPHPRGARRGPCHARLPAGDEGGRQQQGDPEDRASRGPDTQPPPTGGPDGSLRGELCEQQVRLRAPAGERCKFACSSEPWAACLSTGSSLKVACASCTNPFWRGLQKPKSFFCPA